MIAKALLIVTESVARTEYDLALTRAGLAVSCVTAAREAMDRCVADGPFDLVVADVTESGRAAAEHLLAFCPATRVLFLAPCPVARLLQQDLLDAGVFGSGRAAFLRKPVPASVLVGRALGLMDGFPLSLCATVNPENYEGKSASAAA